MKTKKVKIILLIVGSIMILVGACFMVKKFESREKANKIELEVKITAVESKIAQLEEELKKVTNPDQKQKLETKTRQLKQKLTNLKNQLNGSPQKTSRQFTVKYNGMLGGKKHEFINTANPKEKILIDANNKSLGSVWYVKGNQYTISFKEEDAAKIQGFFCFW